MKRAGRALAVVAVIIVAAPLILAAEVVREARRSIALPRPDGPYAVGRTLQTWPRSAIQAGGPRDQSVFIWYPAVAQVSQPAAYLPKAWAQATGMMGPNIRLQDWSRIEANSREGARAMVRAGGFPVVVLTPGYTALPTDYTVLAEGLASRGYVVVGMTPGCCARVSVDKDGRISTPSRGRRLSDADQGQVIALAASEVAEAQAVLGRLDAMNHAAKGELAGRFDLSRLAMVGHSLGGTASLQACAVEARCRAAVDLDGEPAGPVVRTGLAKPLLILRREARPAGWLSLLLTGQTRREQAIVRARADRDDAFLVGRASPGSAVVELAGAGHGDFADLAVLSPTLGRIVGLLGPVAGRTELKIAVDRMSAFLNAHV